MLFNMMFGRFFRVLISMCIVTVRDVGMMGRLLVAPGSIVLGRLLVMSGCMFVMLRCFRVMFCALLAHRGFYRVFGLTAGVPYHLLQTSITMRLGFGNGKISRCDAGDANRVMRRREWSGH
jgi:hypothetical protein